VNTWHVSEHDLAAYLTGRTGTVLAASVEAHVLGCTECRGSLATTAGAATRQETERRWESLVEQIDRPSTSVLSRWSAAHPSLLTRASVSSRPQLAAWLTALAVVLVLPVLAVVLAGREATTVLLAVAPLAPMAAVVLAYRQATDPAGELALATPLSGFRLVTTRALLVALVAAPAGVLVGLAGGVPTYVALGWLLPGLALSALVLCAGTILLDPTVAAALLGGAWAMAVTVPSLPTRGTSDLVTTAVTSPSTQLIALAVAVGASAIAFARRDHVTYRRTA
jgi:hypothetical protein